MLPTSTMLDVLHLCNVAIACSCTRAGFAQKKIAPQPNCNISVFVCINKETKLWFIVNIHHLTDSSLVKCRSRWQKNDSIWNISTVHIAKKQQQQQRFITLPIVSLFSVLGSALLVFQINRRSLNFVEKICILWDACQFSYQTTIYERTTTTKWQ